MNSTQQNEVLYSIYHSQEQQFSIISQTIIIDSRIVKKLTEENV